METYQAPNGKPIVRPHNQSTSVDLERLAQDAESACVAQDPIARHRAQRSARASGPM